MKPRKNNLGGAESTNCLNNYGGFKVILWQFYSGFIVIV